MRRRLENGREVAYRTFRSSQFITDRRIAMSCGDRLQIKILIIDRGVWIANLLAENDVPLFFNEEVVSRSSSVSSCNEVGSL